MNVLFYSNKCEYSKSVILSLEKEKLLDYFKLVSVDDPEVRKRLSGLIKIVPSMMLVDCENVLTLTDIFKWIEGQRFLTKSPVVNNTSGCVQKQSLQSNTMDKLNNLKNKLCAVNNTANNNAETNATNTNTENKTSFEAFDQYSRFVQLTPIDKEEPSNNSYCGVNENNANAIFTPIVDKDDLHGNKLSTKKHTKMLESRENARKLENLERNMIIKKPKETIDFTKEAPKEELVHVGYFTEIVKELNKQERHSNKNTDITTNTTNSTPSRNVSRPSTVSSIPRGHHTRSHRVSTKSSH